MYLHGTLVGLQCAARYSNGVFVRLHEIISSWLMPSTCTGDGVAGPASTGKHICTSRGSHCSEHVSELGSFVQGIDLGKIYSGHRGRQAAVPAVPSWSAIMAATTMRLCTWTASGGALMTQPAMLVGSWAELVHKCELGKIQPSVLFFKPT